MIYFDHNATTAIHPEVLDEMMPYYKGQYGNPASNHRFGRKALTAIEEARERVANAVNAHSSHVIFTASGTESNNTIINPTSPSKNLSTNMPMRHHSSIFCPPARKCIFATKVTKINRR